MNELIRRTLSCIKDELSLLKSKTSFVDKTSIAKVSIAGNANASGGNLTNSLLRTDTGLVVNTTNIVNGIGGDFVVLDFNEYLGGALTNAKSRISPVLELLKNGTVVSVIDTAYERHGTGDAGSSNGGTYTDESPSAGDTWSLRTQQGSNQNDIEDITLGHFTMRVVEKIEVLKV